MPRLIWFPRLVSFLLLPCLAGAVGCDGASGSGDDGSAVVYCERTGECPSGQLCVGGVCRGSGGSGGDVLVGAECDGDADCGYGRRCVEAQCVDDDQECLDDGQCTDAPGGTCVDRRCSYPQPVGCQSDDECPGQVCNRGTGDCEPPPDPCAAGCEDGDPCTTDTCGLDGCTHAPVPDCCTDGAACDDGNPCTDDACVQSACSHAPVGDPDCCVADADCDDGDADTVDRCLEGRCRHLDPCASAGECDDAETCTVDRCSGGGCLHEWVAGCCHDGADCNDGDPCTADRCIGGGCQYTAAPGCCEADADCEDGNACTTNTCDAATGNCRTESVTGCCRSAGECDDGDSCTTDSCDGDGACRNARVPGCCAVDSDCDDGLGCTADTCSADHTCTNAWVANCCSSAADCEDGNPCTTDTCGAGGLCTNPRVPGCCAAAADCDDGDPCTRDRCNANTCESVPDVACCVADGDCDDGDFCTVDTCVDHSCTHAGVAGCCTVDADCDDGVAATVDTCDPRASTCTNEVRTACATAAECDDGDDCTDDRCEAEVCAWYLVLDPTCRCAVEGDCDAAEVCSLLQLEDGGIWGYCFQSDGELPMGAHCDPDDAVACESGLCLELMGTTVCFGACATSADCAESASCRPTDLPSGGEEPDHEISLCVPPPIACADDGGCPADMYCDGFTVPEAPGELVIGCLYADETLARTGDPCVADEECNSGFCLPDEVQGGICFGLCDADADCGAGQRCYEDYVRLSLTMGTETTADDRVVSMPACAWDFGSLDPCSREADCGGAEVCFPLLNDAETAFAPACVLPPDGTTVPPGGVCTSNAQCQSGVCVSGLRNPRCLQFCISNGDCLGSSVCDSATFTLPNDDGSTTELIGTVCID